MKQGELEKAIMARMVAEEAQDMSGAEITRTLQGCVCGHGLIKQATKMAAEGVSLAVYMQTGEIVRTGK